MPLFEGGDPPDNRPAAGRVGVEDAYQRHADLLRDIAEKKFRIPTGDAEALVNEIFIAFLLRRDVVKDPRKWLIGAVCHASRGYWRAAAKVRPLPPDFDDHADPLARDLETQIVDRVTLAAALNRCSPKCRDTLRLYYEEGYSAAELAAHFDTSEGYVMQLLHTCRKKIREIYMTLRSEGKR